MSKQTSLGEAETPPPGMRSALSRYFARFDDGELLRWTFRGLLAGTVGILALDYLEMRSQPTSETLKVEAPQLTPLLPPVANPAAPSQNDPRTHFTGDREELRRPMRFTLSKGGVLEASGTIDAGASLRLDQELKSRGEYVRIISLNSPGGSVQDAMVMGKLLRASGISAEVVDGALCASSCPLLLAGGEKRLVGPQAAIGVHQFYAVSGGRDARSPGPAEAMSDAQITTARISRYLGELGVDPALWLHAMDTPPQSLYYLSADEMKKYRLATGAPQRS